MYRTFCGGMLSILAFVVILFFSTSEILMYILGNKYNESVIFSDLKYNNDLVFNISDTQAMTTFQFVATDYAIRSGVNVT